MLCALCFMHRRTPVVVLGLVMGVVGDVPLRVGRLAVNRCHQLLPFLGDHDIQERKPVLLLLLNRELDPWVLSIKELVE